jgi:hypothetical protein
MVRTWASLTSAAHRIGPPAIVARGCVSFRQAGGQECCGEQRLRDAERRVTMHWSVGDDQMSRHHTS